MQQSNEKRIHTIDSWIGITNTQKRVIIFGTHMALSGCRVLQTSATSTNYIQPEDTSLLTGETIREIIVGNTVEGESSKYPGNFYVEYYLEDGTISGLWNEEPYSGKWANSGSVWCYKYTDLKGCNTIALNGDEITWIKLDGVATENKAMLFRGNPKNL